MAAGDRDRHWRRLVWLLPMALGLSLLSLDGFVLLLQGGTYAPRPPKPVDVEVVEIPPMPPPPSAPVVAPPTVETPPPEPAPPSAAVEAPAPAAEMPSPAPTAPPPAAETPAPIAETPPLASPTPPAPAVLNKVPAPTPPPVSGPVVAAPEAPAAAPAPPASAPKRGPQITTAAPQEVTRGGFPGMLTEPMAPAAPLTKEEWDRQAKLYNTGDDHQGQVEAERSPVRSARSARIAPLTKEEYARLAKIHNTGDDHQGQVEAERAPIRSARSKPSRPLTKEEYARQAEIYWTGMDNGEAWNTPAVREAGVRGALSFQASLVAPAAAIDYGIRFHSASGDRTAMAIEQPPPEIPAEISPARAVVVVARFHVAADGSAEVVLVSPAPEARLNDALLTAFKNWRFEPASRFGRAVDSSIDYRLTLAPSLSVRVASTVKLLATPNPAEVARRGTPASPIETPPPELPADLLQPNASWTAVVRVHVAPDGTAEAVITTPTTDPAVTRALDSALRRWRFRPTYIPGSQPQDSTIELSVALSVS